MKLEKYKLLGSDDECFRMQDTQDGKEFRVAKKGLGKGTLDRISQHFADGGEVQRFYDGGAAERIQQYTQGVTTEPQPAPPLQLVGEDNAVFYMSDGTRVPKDELDQSQVERLSSQVDIRNPRTVSPADIQAPVRTLGPGQGSGPLGMAAQASMGSAKPPPTSWVDDVMSFQRGRNEQLEDREIAQHAASGAGVDAAAGAIKDAVAAGPYRTNREKVRLGLETTDGKPVAPVDTAAQPAPPAPVPQQAPPPPAPMPGTGGAGPVVPRMPGAPPGFDAATKQMQEGVKAEAKVAQDLAAAQGIEMEKQAKAKAAFDSEYQRRMTEHQARRDQMTSDILNSKIDPNKLWGSRSTGQKVQATIGLILSGIGSAHTGGPNLAMQVIGKAIDADIDAQKANLDTKKGVLANHMQAGHDLQSAHQMEKADMMDNFAAQLQRAANQFAGPKAQAEAQRLAGELTQKSIQVRSQLELSAMDREIKKAELAAKAGAGGANPELVVPNFGLGLDKEATKEARKLSADYRAVKSSLSVLKEHRKKYGSETMDRAAVERGKTLAIQLQLKLKNSEQLGTLDKGAERVLENLISGDPGKYGFYLSQLEALEEGTDNTFDSRMSQYMDPRTYRSQSAADVAGKYGARQVR